MPNLIGRCQNPWFFSSDLTKTKALVQDCKLVIDTCAFVLEIMHKLCFILLLSELPEV